MNRHDIAGIGLAGESAVEFIDRLPAVQVQRLGHCAPLIVILMDALEGGLRAIASRDVSGETIGSLAG
ncbi:hypothetical protein D3C84_1280550 [compost metagenome]